MAADRTFAVEGCEVHNLYLTMRGWRQSARLLYKDEPFIILNEPTAALDPIEFSDRMRDKDFILDIKVMHQRCSDH